MPNSRTRRDTADLVSRLASRNAATSTAMASHLPRLLARLEALARDPVTSLARWLELVTVALGSSEEISLDTPLMLARVGGRHVDRVHVVLHAGQGLRPGQRDEDVGGLCHAGTLTMPMTLKLVPATVIAEPVDSLLDVA